MRFVRTGMALAGLTLAAAGYGQVAGQPELRIEASNRTLTVSAEGEVTAEPDVAILHIGFETQLGDAKSVYDDGGRISNAIVSALKQAGIPETAIRSEMQHLDRDYTKPHKFKLVQRWTVRTAPARAAEVLDAAITAGATSSGEIEWTVKDEHALETQALDKAAANAREQAEVLAKGMGVHLGALIYVSNQLSAVRLPFRPLMAKAGMQAAEAPQPLSIEPQKVSRQANVYAVFAIE